MSFLIQHKLLILLLFCGLASCVQESSPFSENDDTLLSVNSISSPEGFWYVELAETRSIFDDSNTYNYLDGALIRLEDITSGQEITFEAIGEGKYQSVGHVPQKGHRYELFIDTDQFGTSISRTYVPDIGEVRLNISEERDISGGKAIDLELSISNPTSQNNFYVWEVFESDLFLFDSEAINNDEEILAFQNPNESLGPKGNGSLVFTDHADEEGAVNTNLIAALPISDGGDDNLSIANHSFKIKIRAVSEDLFNYLQSVDNLDAESIQQSSFYQSSTINNIENGVGIFGAYSEKTITIY